MISHLNPRSENILPSHDAQLELQSVNEATQFRTHYHYHGIDAEESILTKSLPNLGIWALPNLLIIINTRVTEVSPPKWSLGSPHSDVLIIWEPFLLFHNSSEKCAMIFLGSFLTFYPNI